MRISLTITLNIGCHAPCFVWLPCSNLFFSGQTCLQKLITGTYVERKGCRFSAYGKTACFQVSSRCSEDINTGDKAVTRKWKKIKIKRGRGAIKNKTNRDVPRMTHRLPKAVPFHVCTWRPPKLCRPPRPLKTNFLCRWQHISNAIACTRGALLFTRFIYPCNVVRFFFTIFCDLQVYSPKTGGSNMSKKVCSGLIWKNRSVSTGRDG